MKKTISISRSIRMVPLLFVILFAGATLANSVPCPPAGDISPCVCHGNQTITDVVCSNITSEDHLKKILRPGRFGEVLPHLVLQNLPFSTLPSLGGPYFRVNDLEILDGKISHFSEDAFYMQPLHSLRVDRNRLADVPSAALSAVWFQLKVLSMSGNILTKLENRSINFMYVQNLTLSENKISRLDRVSFPGIVKYIWISRNQLTTFNGSLESLYQLKYLDASYNKLTSMKGEIDGLWKLETVILDHNQISDISGTFLHIYWKGRSAIRELSLVGNRIQEIGEALVELEQLTHLNLSRNAITNLNQTAFENLINLYDLNLSENPLTTFQFCPTLKPLMSLRILNLSNSNLTNFSSDCFDNNTNLEFVDVSRNQLSVLGLPYATKLVNLDIRFNNFKSVHNLELSTNGSAVLVLEDNLWRCSRRTTSGLKDLDERGYIFPSGYPTCYRNSVKPKGCQFYNSN